MSDLELPPVYVPSRGRADRKRARTITSMWEQGLPFTVIVPLGEQAEYEACWPGITVVGVAVRGIGITRRTIVNMARIKGYERIWLVDDDILHIGHRDTFGGPYVRVPWIQALVDMSARAVPESNIGMSGPMPRWHAFAHQQPIRNGRVGYVVLLRIDHRWNYWPFLHEDTDITIQVLDAGMDTVCWPDYAYHTARMSTKVGGCQEDYKRGAADEAASALTAKWNAKHPGLISVSINRFGAIVTRVHWQRFK